MPDKKCNQPQPLTCDMHMLRNWKKFLWALNLPPNDNDVKGQNSTAEAGLCCFDAYFCSIFVTLDVNRDCWMNVRLGLF